MKNESRTSTKSNNRKTNGSKRSNPGRRPKSKGYTSKSSDRDDDLKSSTNDPSWYAADPALLRDSASVPFSWAVGTPIDLGDIPVDLGKLEGTTCVPGIMTLQSMPTFGTSFDSTSPLNIAANSTYAYVRHANSGHSNYDAPDLMIYLLAFTQVYSYINYLQRLYGIMTLYSQRNRYMPKALIQCQDCEFEDIQRNLANFRYGINLLISKASSFAIPNNMPLFQREAFMYQNIYTEGETVKDQIYLFKPHSFLFYVENEQGAHLDRVKVRWDDGATGTVDTLLKYGEDMLAPLIYSEDINIMSGDILKAYGNDNILKLASLGEAYPIQPIYQPDVLEQIKNATYGPFIGNFGVWQSKDKSCLLSYNFMPIPADDALGKVRLALAKQAKILTTSKYDPDATTVMENTRLMHSIGETVTDFDGQVIANPIYCGSDYIRSISVWTFEQTTMGWLLMEHTINPNYVYNDADPIDGKLRLLDASKAASLVSSFRYHPQIVVASYAADSKGEVGLIENYHMNFGIDNYAVIDHKTLTKLHEAALMSMTAVPSIAKFSSATGYKG